MCSIYFSSDPRKMETPEENILGMGNHPLTPKREIFRRQRRTTGLETPVTHLTLPSIKPRRLFPRNLAKSMSDATVLSSNPEITDREGTQETCYPMWSEGENGSKVQKANEGKWATDSTGNTDQPASNAGDSKHPDGSREVQPEYGNVPVRSDESKDGDVNCKAPRTLFG